MTFSETAFESFYPDEEGQIEARKRLIFHARHFFVKNASENVSDEILAQKWKTEILNNKEYRFYLCLLSEPEVLEHIIAWVFVGFSAK